MLESIDHGNRFTGEKPSTAAALLAFLQTQSAFAGRKMTALNQDKGKTMALVPVASVAFLKIENGACAGSRDLSMGGLLRGAKLVQYF